MVTFEDVLNNEEFKIYIRRSDELLGVLGYTDHSASHTLKVGTSAENILLSLGYTKREGELAKIAGFLHDIGNMINRHDHANTGGIISFGMLSKMDMPPDEIAQIVAAIGNHDELTGTAISPISAAVIISDKTDVRRSRVRNHDLTTFDIHDRVNYAVKFSKLSILEKEKIISLEMEIDTSICSVMDYFEIFLSRMVMCKRAAEFLKVKFQLIANSNKLL